MRHNPLSMLFRVVEFALLAVGAGCLGFYGGTELGIHRLRGEAMAAVNQMLVARDAPALALPSTSPDYTRVNSRLDIPRLHLSAPVISGDAGDSALDFAVEYLPMTPPPWLPGNSALAAHRDGLFRPLADIRTGDKIWLATAHGNFEYRVLRTVIVTPSDVWVLRSIPHVNLTLITCYPFVYVGHAPQRFIVQAEKVDLPNP
jgi:sortase A